MCGICGIVDFVRQPSLTDVERMTGSLIHRGPDMGGTCSFGSCVLGHRRLSILDLSRSAGQPMISADGMVALVFNGEIYNFRELAQGLAARGHRFRTRSDTEVILELYLDRQESLVEDLNGMFSFALWDERKKRLMLARDRVGKKPLYYCLYDDRLVFSSELSSLIQVPWVPRDICDQSLFEYLLYDFIPAPHTIFSKVRKLPAGHMAIFDRDGLRLHRYWEPPRPERALDFNEQARDLERLISDAVRMRLVSDVPLGAFLSGGLDSTLVTSLMTTDGSDPVQTFNISFPNTSHDESAWARLASARLKTHHREYPVNYDFENIFERLVRHFGEPFGDSSAIPTWHLCRETRTQVTVALSGDGGDELFGGYERYLARRFQIAYDLIPAAIRERVVEPLIDRLPSTTDYYGTSLTKKLKLFVTAAARTRENPDAVIPGTFSRADAVRLTGEDYRPEMDPVLHLARQYAEMEPASRMMITDVQTYLAEDILTKVDRMSMAHSLEVRCPLLDFRVVEAACRMPVSLKIKGMTTKRILRAVARDHVPPEVLARSKYGFQVPLGAWFKGELRTWAQDRLLDYSHSYFNAGIVESLWKEHQSGRQDHTHKLWLILVFNEWFRQIGKFASNTEGLTKTRFFR